MAFVERYVTWLHHGRFAVIALWIILAGVASIFAMDFISKTSQTFSALPGTKSKVAQDMMTQYFPSMGVATNIVVYLQSLDGVAVTEKRDMAGFDAELLYRLQLRYNASGFMSMYESYWQVAKAPGMENGARKEFISPDNQTTFIVVTVNSMSTTKASTDAADLVQHVMDEYSPHFNNTRATSLGLPSFIKTIVKSTEKNMGTVDAVSIPLAMLVLLFILKSWRLLLLPLCNMGLTAATSFGLMTGVASHMDVNSVAPSLMMSILVAMSIDYNLFLLTRYREELTEVSNRMGGSIVYTDGEKGLLQWRHRVISIMVHTAGETISVSALTLGVCFLGLLIFPMDFIQSIGLANAITIFLTLLINITFTPATLLAFPTFFEKCIIPWRNPFKKHAPDAEQEGLLDSVNERPLGSSNSGIANPPANHNLQQSTESTEMPALRRDVWWKLATLSLSFPWSIMLVVGIIALTIPFDLYGFNNAHTDAMDLFLPRGAEVTDAYTDMGNRFGLGKIYPVQALMVLRDEAPWNTTNSVQFYKATNEFIDTLIEEVPYVDKNSISGPTYYSGQHVNYYEVDLCLLLLNVTKECTVFNHTLPWPIQNITEGLNITEMCHSCQALVMLNSTFVSEDQRAMYFIISPMVDPLGKYGGEIRSAMLDVASRYEERLHANIHFTGYNAITWDTMWKIFDMFPAMIAVEGLVVFIILGVVFRSIFIPLRAVLTIGLTLAWTFGFCDLVYEHNILGWLGIEAFKEQGAVVWTNTIVLFSMIVGIGLDYDIFLLTRIKEYYDEAKLSDDARGLEEDQVEPRRTINAIRRGLCGTGHIITAAGLIMGVAFSGLFFSDIPVINQMGFYLVFSVLFDTFVVRSVLVPAMMGLLGKYNWWPLQLLRSCHSTRNYAVISAVEYEMGSATQA